MMRRRLRVLVAGFNRAAGDYTLARLEISSAHARMLAPPVVERLGVLARANDPAQVRRRDAGRVWRSALAQVRAADRYVRTGASAVARRHAAWSRLCDAFARLVRHAVAIETLRKMQLRARRRSGR